MKHIVLSIVALAGASSLISGCAVAKATGKVAALPVKGAYHTTKFAGKSVYHTGRFTGKAVYNTGKGVYYVGMVPVKITDKALDTSSKVLTVTTQAVDLTGKVVTTSHQIAAFELDAELANIKRAKNIIGVTIDAAG